MVLLQEAWVHDETIIEALNFLEGVSVNVINRNYNNITHFSSQFVLRNILYYSITEDDPPAMKHGCLVWWTLHTNQPLDIWKLSPSVMSHCCPLFRPMLPMEQ